MTANQQYISIHDRIVPYKELNPQYGIKFSRVHIQRLENEGKFPRRVRLSTHCVGWLASELSHWLEDRVAARGAAA